MMRLAAAAGAVTAAVLIAAVTRWWTGPWPDLYLDDEDSTDA